MYIKGYGVKVDYKTALDYLTKAAEHGDDMGQYDLGSLYENGQGVAQDKAAAMGWYLLSAQQDYDLAKKAVERLKSAVSGSDMRKAKAFAKDFKVKE
jgi:TPR repeat protein